MMMAQRLYEAGYITYMRTDSTNLSQDAVTMVRDYISDNFGKIFAGKRESVRQQRELAGSARSYPSFRCRRTGGIAERYGS